MSRVEQAICGTPWAITEAGMDQIMAVATRMTDPEAVEKERGKELRSEWRVRIRDGVAVVPIHGPLFRYANLFTRFSGATSYEQAGVEIGAALKDPQIRGIVLDIDSPGGMVNAVQELGEIIRSARGTKPVVAHISGQGTSAAYWIASAAETVTAGPTAMVGSIGAVMEVRERETPEGEKRWTYVSAVSPRKRLEPGTEEGGAQIQSVVDELGQVFVATVAQYRETTVDDVLANYGQGGIMVGREALEAGMVDRLTTLEEVIAGLSSGRRPSGASMTAEDSTIDNPEAGRGLPGEPAAGGSDSSPDEEDTTMSDVQDTPAAEGPSPEEIRLQAAKDERERIAAIRAMKAPKALEDRLIAEGTAIGDAAVQVLAAKNAAAEAQGRAHLEARRETEADTPEVLPGTPESAAGNDRTRAAQAVALYNQMRGRQVGPATA